jgi:hypothetical protein
MNLDLKRYPEILHMMTYCKVSRKITEDVFDTRQWSNCDLRVTVRKKVIIK